MKYVGYLLFDPEDSTEVQFAFVIEIPDNYREDGWKNEYTIDYDEAEIIDYIGEYDYEEYYFQDKDVKNTIYEAQREIMKDLFEGP